MRIRVRVCHCDLKGEHEQLRPFPLSVILDRLDQDNYSIDGLKIVYFGSIKHWLIRDIRVDVGWLRKQSQLHRFPNFPAK
jgi:hypothetical protein